MYVWLGPNGYKITHGITLLANDQWSVYSSDKASLFMAYVLMSGMDSPRSALYLPFNLYYAIFGKVSILSIQRFLRNRFWGFSVGSARAEFLT